MSEIVNRVAQSSIITINLEEIYPKEDRVVFDISSFLFQGLVLREKEFRSSLKEIDWEKYSNKWVAIFCSADAIVPNWAFMLVGTYLDTVSKGYAIGSLDQLEIVIAERLISEINPNDYLDRPVVIKGCSDLAIPLYAYGRIVERIQPYAKSIMYGEPCSTVPLFKKKSS